MRSPDEDMFSKVETALDNMATGAGTQNSNIEDDLDSLLFFIHEKMKLALNDDEPTDGDREQYAINQLAIADTWAGIVSTCISFAYTCAAPLPGAGPQVPILRGLPGRFQKIENMAGNLRSAINQSARNLGASAITISISQIGIMSIGISFPVI